MRAAILVALTLALLVACRPVQPTALPQLAETWIGTLPCEGCAGADHRLTLNPDGSYWLSVTYRGYPQGDPPPVHELGRYTIAERRYALASGEATHALVLTRGGKLEVERTGTRPVALRREPFADRELGPLRLRGMLTHLADATLFESCESGVVYAVQGGAGKPTAELEYRAAASAPGAPLLVALVGRIQAKPAGEEGLASWISIEAWERAVPGASCDGAPPQRRD